MTVDPSLTFESRDEYNRKPIAKKIICLLESDIDVSPLVIDGGWGTGKSEFCHKLINLLESNKDTNLRSVYIDAFKADHADEPLMTLLAAVITLLPKKDKKTFIKKAIPAARFVAKTSLKAGMNFLLRQEITEVMDEFDEVLTEAGDDLIDKSVVLMLKDHVQADESIESLKKSLVKLIKENPIVIFIDELDRCRPDFAISMLENIKHIFDVEGVQFVLVVNSEQLRASVNHCYGSSVVAQKYLDKFIGFKFYLSNIVDSSLSLPKHVSEDHFLALIQANEIFDNTILNSKYTGLHKVIFEIISSKNLSLREVETFVKYLSIYNTLSNSNGLRTESFGYGLLNIIGVYLFCFIPEVFSGKDINIPSVLQAIGQKTIDFDVVIDEYRPATLEIITALFLIEDQYPHLEGVKESKKIIINEWNKHITELFRGGYGYERDPVKALKYVFMTLTMKSNN